MTQVVSFPGLGIEGLTLDRVALYIGDWPIYWYGVILGAAMLLGVGYIYLRSPRFGLNPEETLDVLLLTVAIGIVGARVYYVAFSWEDFRGDILSVVKLWEGGIAIYGSIIGGVLAAWVMCRKKKIPFLTMTDAITGGLLLGQSIGRWGNFVNVEAFGSNTTLPWGMSSPSITAYLAEKQGELAALGVMVDPAMPVHPTFLYESLWTALGFALLHIYSRYRRYDGQMTLLYFAWYGAGRSVIEGLRTDSLMLGGVRVSQALAAILLVVCVAVLLRLRRKEDLPLLFVHTSQGRANALWKWSFFGGKKAKTENPDRKTKAAKQKESVSPEGQQEQGNDAEKKEKDKHGGADH